MMALVKTEWLGNGVLAGNMKTAECLQQVADAFFHVNLHVETVQTRSEVQFFFFVSLSFVGLNAFFLLTFIFASFLLTLFAYLYLFLSHHSTSSTGATGEAAERAEYSF